MKNKKFCIILFALLSVLAMGYIFSNSMRSMEISDKQSQAITEYVKPVVDANNKSDSESLNNKIRKLAHAIEFGMLGLILGALSASMYFCFKRRYIALPLFLALAVGVADEYIQSFYGRSSLVKDIIIDFSGGVCGVLFAFIIATVIGIIIKRRSKIK